ncbi:MAG TPA: carboxylesterase family protein, partial [Opitutaceae bacterium]
FRFDHPTPIAADAPAGSVLRAYHSSDIVFTFRVLEAKDLPWSAEDHAVSELMADYWTNFAKDGDPNGPGLPDWPRYEREAGDPVMHLRAGAAAAPDGHRSRYEFLDSLP